MTTPRCPGKSEYGHGFNRTTVHHGCCVQVLDQDLIWNGDRYLLTLDVGLLRTQFIVAPAGETGCGWHGYLATPGSIDCVSHGATASEAAAALDHQLRGLARLEEAMRCGA